MAEPCWSFDLPEKLKLAIADCILLYSKIESCVVELIWVIEDPDPIRKREIAKAWGDENFRIVKKVVKSIPGAESDAIWPALKDLGQERNLIGHGVWMISDDERPMVVWHARSIELGEGIEAQYFDWKRFDRFFEIGNALLKTFREFKNLVEDGLHSGEVQMTPHELDVLLKRLIGMVSGMELATTAVVEALVDQGVIQREKLLRILIEKRDGLAPNQSKGAFEMMIDRLTKPATDGQQ